jgi:hypothetical protein
VFRHSQDSTDLESASVVAQTICELIQYRLIPLVKKKGLLADIAVTLADAIDAVPFRKVAFTMEFLLMTLLHRIDDIRYLKQLFKGEALSKMLQSNELLRRHLIRMIGRASLVAGNLILSNNYVKNLVHLIEEAGDNYSYCYEYLPEKLRSVLNGKKHESEPSIQEKASYYDNRLDS